MSQLLGVLVLIGLLATTAGGAAVRASTVVTRSGIAATLPPRWHVVDRRLTLCSDPVERLAVSGRGALVMLQERLGGSRGFAGRPDRFELEGKPYQLECCAPLQRAGWFLNFRDAGRGFYAYVYLGAAGTRAEALAILGSLRISRSRR